ncbi:MAG: Flp pilus assembly complex ATPase component TadA [Candidatus Aenigmarchaeota archaeon]|nr:Flp pilus assembly complex ATPase component TadA [Candidatus Aenigmarchaeota archaeon]
MKIVPDTSVLVQGKLSELIVTQKLTDATIIFPRAVIDELQAQASRGREVGFQGLEEIKKVRSLAGSHRLTLEFTGERPTLEEIQLAKKGRIDALIRDVARKENATLLTGDYVQALVGEVEGVAVHHIPPAKRDHSRLEAFFSPQTQSVHLKVGVVPMAKVGKPGAVELVPLRKKALEEEELKTIIDDVLSKARTEEDTMIEIGRHGAMVVQMGLYRIAICRPPFADRLEVTAVRPIAKVSLQDYQLHADLEKGLLQSKGMLIAGPPGAGKSSFAAAVADFLSGKGKIVKTFEQPRDLQVGPDVTQYAPLEGDWAKTSDLLLLVRPDYTIFDEVRKTPDFKVFADMRLAGVGMIGVIHATDPLSAIQRFIGRIELGTIPHVINTVVFISAGKIATVYELSLTVKVPSGMQDADLSRPVVEVRDFGTKALLFEIYSFGQENIIVPVQQEASPLAALAKERAQQVLRKYDPAVEVDIAGGRVIARVPNDSIGRLIGKNGATVGELERLLGMPVSVEPLDSTLKREVVWSFEERGQNVLVYVDRSLLGKEADLYVGQDYLMTVFVGKGGQIRIRKRSPAGKRVLAAAAGKALRALV